MRRLLSITVLALALSSALFASYPIASSTFAGSENPLSEGGNWTLFLGSGLEKVSGAVRPLAVAEFSDARWSGTALPSDQYETITVAVNTGASWTVYMYVRLTSGLDGYQFYFVNDGTWFLRRLDAGTPTTLTSGSGLTINATDVVQLRALATSIMVEFNGSRLTSVTDATYFGIGLTCGFIPHVVTAVTDVQVTDWEAGAEVTPNIFKATRLR